MGSALTLSAGPAKPFTVDQISASGNKGLVTFSFLVNASGGNLDPVSGQYQPGATTGVTDVIVGVDAAGNVGLLSLTVTP
ncbi:MAG: hypothetical protein ACYCW6_26925 [Candidatus Xenobia bacterium]